MRILLVGVNEEPKEIVVPNDLHTLQQLVGGYIEPHPIDGEDGVVLLMDEDGKLKGRPFNAPLVDRRGEIYDYIAGDFLVVGVKGEDFCELTDEQLKKYKELYQLPKAKKVRRIGYGV